MKSVQRESGAENTERKPQGEKEEKEGTNNSYYLVSVH